MALITLICPHCGGNFELDRDRALQPFLTCPYCGNRSLMQKNEDNIRLRGILPGKGQPTAATTHTPLPTEAATTANELWASEMTAMPVRPLEEIIAEAQAILPDLPGSEVSKEDAAVDSAVPAGASLGAAAIQPEITDNNQSAVKPLEKRIDGTEALAAVLPAANPDETNAPEAKAAAPTGATNGHDIERLCKLAEDAAAKHDLPLFNAYSRQAIDCQPKDPRIYALRAALTEEADGFARSTWTNPTWLLQTPRQKKAAVAQHLYNLNTALKYSRPERQHELINQFAWQLVRQAIDYFTEQAELRCSQNLFFKTFKGRYHRSDLRAAVRFAETVKLIDKQTSPLCWEELHDATRKEIRQAPPKVAKKLRRF